MYKLYSFQILFGVAVIIAEIRHDMMMLFIFSIIFCILTFYNFLIETNQIRE